MKQLDGKILIADDDEAIRISLQQIIIKENLDVILANNGDEAIAKSKSNKIGIAFIDLMMHGKNGIEVLKELKEISPGTHVIIITGYATVDSAVDAMKYGAYDYLQKPFSVDTIRILLDKILANKPNNVNIPGNQLKFYSEGQVETIIGESPRMKEIYELVLKVAPTDSTVLITGETGTGKELIAKAIHYNSPRKNSPFMTVDCCSLVETLFESELFGHVKGSFTGAIATKHGSFELANGGTFFFDEIGNISPNIQAKILRAIQEREIKRVGATETLKVDVRVIAATNKDLLQSVKDGSFREDLFYRISVIPIHLPPLRERKEDILPLALSFLDKYNQRRKRNILGISEEVKKIFLEYQWPGNVRELENVVERAVVIENENEITTASLSQNLKHIKKNNHLYDNGLKSMEDMEKDHILKVLEATNWNRSYSSRILDIDRKTLYDKIKRYQLKKK